MKNKAIERYYFVCGGVILPRLAQVTIETLESQAGVTLANKLRIAIYDQEKGLFFGQNKEDKYLDAVCGLGVWQGGRAALETALLGRLQADSGALAVARDIAREAKVYLYADYPRKWLDEAAARVGLFDYFDPQMVLYPQRLEKLDTPDGFFTALNDAGHALPGASLWVDAHPLRTSAAVRRGIHAIVYVDERRLRRELGLRRLPGGLPGY